MTPKEKSAELFISYIYTVSNPLEQLDKLKANIAIQCALIAVDEILNAVDWHNFETPNIPIDFWNEVKQELNKL